ncbi:MAG: hypothetical protein AAF431_13775 [Pseudomonadota bacterium]
MKLIEDDIKKIDTAEAQNSYDQLIASLFVLLTHHSLTHSDDSADAIVSKLNILCEHSDIEYYPDQHRVFLKMRKLWRIKQFKAGLSEMLH